MPFYLYDVDGQGDSLTYTRRRSIPLAGKNGPILRAVAPKLGSALSQPDRNRKKGIEWHVSASELVSQLKGSPETQKIIIDLKPRVDDNVSLYQLLDIWGMTHETWTPVAVLLQPLFVDEKPTALNGDKNSFTLDRATLEEKELVGEFLYLNGGYGRGYNKWVWGRNGNVNAVLLWPKTFRYLAGALGDALGVNSSTEAK